MSDFFEIDFIKIESKKSGDIILFEVKYQNRNQIVAIEIP